MFIISKHNTEDGAKFYAEDTTRLIDRNLFWHGYISVFHHMDGLYWVVIHSTSTLPKRWERKSDGLLAQYVLKGYHK